MKTQLSEREAFVLLGAVHDRIDFLEDDIKTASEELLLLQILEKKLKATT